MIVTTARKQVDRLKEEAQAYVAHFNGVFIDRQQRSIEDFYREFGEQPLLIVAKDKLILHRDAHAAPFYYHPNAALLRYKQWKKTGHDPFLSVVGLSEGETMIDATLGMGADAVLAQVAVGASGSVTGLEANPYIAFIVKQGFASWSEGDDQFTTSLQNIHVVQTENLTYLKACPPESVDVVYFDPMFEVRMHSPGLAGLKQFASYQSLTEEVVKEAKRVAKHKIVLKNPTSSSLFARLGFSVHYRPHASFQYGIIQKNL